MLGLEHDWPGQTLRRTDDDLFADIPCDSETVAAADGNYRERETVPVDHDFAVSPHVRGGRHRVVELYVRSLCREDATVHLAALDGCHTFVQAAGRSARCAWPASFCATHMERLLIIHC